MSLGASLPPQPAPEQGGPDGRRKSGQRADQTQTELAPGRPPFPQSCLCPGGPRGLRTLRGVGRWQWGQPGFPGRGTRGALGALWDSHWERPPLPSWLAVGALDPPGAGLRVFLSTWEGGQDRIWGEAGAHTSSLGSSSEQRPPSFSTVSTLAAVVGVTLSWREAAGGLPDSDPGTDTRAVATPSAEDEGGRSALPPKGPRMGLLSEFY